MFENITYYILDISEKDKINFSEIIHKEFESLRKSVDGTKCIIKLEGSPKVIFEHHKYFGRTLFSLSNEEYY